LKGSRIHIISHGTLELKSSFKKKELFSLVDGLDPNLGNTYLVALHA
jgi:hypothetical protein